MVVTKGKGGRWGRANWVKGCQILLMKGYWILCGEHAIEYTGNEL